MSWALVFTSLNHCGLPSRAGLVFPLQPPISVVMLAPFLHAVNTFGNDDDITLLSLSLTGSKV
jgi:hypothetical protein